MIWKNLIFDLTMFQQNSYRPERYLRWWKTQNPLKSLWRFTDVRSYKVPLVFTARIKRLIASFALVAAAVFALVALVAHIWLGVVASCLVAYAFTAIFSRPLMLLANLVISPVEKAISRWYLNDAARILASRPDLIIVGVTGSYGKTGTKTYLHRMLSQKYNTLATPGNFNTTLGVVRTVREHLQPTHQVFVVEMGAKQVGDIREICDLVHPRYGVISSIGRMHLETFGSELNIQKTKFELVDALPSDGYAAVNIDSQGVAAYLPTANFAAALDGYSATDTTAPIHASDISYSSSGTSFTICFPDGSQVPVRTRVVGDCNIQNILGAAAIAWRLGVSAEQIRLACATLSQVEHRLSISFNGSYTVIDDAYNANPEGSRMALKVLSNLTLPEGARRIVITPGYVELGPAQQQECELLGREVADAADYAIFVNRLNRDALLAGARSSGRYHIDNIKIADSLSEALTILSGIVRPGDAVLYENDFPDTFK